MKNKLCVCAFVLATSATLLCANKKEEQTQGYQEGTILSIQSSGWRLPWPTPSVVIISGDAPAVSEIYEYDIAVKLNSGTYVGRYESYFDYLPLATCAFYPNQSLPVRLTRNVVHFKLPDREVEMGIVSRPGENISARANTP